MTDERFDEPKSYVNKPYTPQEMNEKITSLRDRFSHKVDKWASATVVGWEGTKIDRKEGEVWLDDDGKKWEMKNGIPRSISKLQDAKIPFWCPNCQRAMSHRFDDKFYFRRGMCYNCVVQHDTKLKIEGKWEEYEKKMLRKNEKGFLRDAIAERKDYIRTFKVPQIHFENGGWQELATLEQFTDMLNLVKKDIEFCENRLKQIEEEEKNEN